MPKRTIDSFFTSDAKRQRTTEQDEPATNSVHPSYPFPIPELPSSIAKEISWPPARPPRVMNEQPDLDMLYFEPYIQRDTAKVLFDFLRVSLPFYRVEYDAKRDGVSAHIRTPRYTTVFGIDETSRFESDGAAVDAQTGARLPPGTYWGCCAPRPIPKCLDDLRAATEAATGCQFNFCLVNYYASGSDSISFHSDDERFLGPEPAIASLSLGATRDFLMKRKPAPRSNEREPQVGTIKQIKLPLAGGDMVLMRGRTQAGWLHSIPKRSGKNENSGGRINITFRRAVVGAGTVNYYTYNVGTGPVYKWDEVSKEMVLYKP